MCLSTLDYSDSQAQYRQTCDQEIWAPPGTPWSSYLDNSLVINTTAIHFQIQAADLMLKDKILSPTSYTTSDIAQLDLPYCLAETPKRTCKIYMQNQILSIVVFCICFKTVVCILILFWLRDDPLVTPGDAFVSFLIKADACTISKCTLDATGIFSRESIKNDVAVVGPRRWKARRMRLWRVIPCTIAVRS
jgi:hypothetical protein